MKFKTTLLALSFTSATFFSQNSAINKANEIVEKAVQARGGKELLQSIKTMYSKSETVMDGRNVNWITREMVPNKGSFEIVYQGRVVFKSFYDGQKGFEYVNGEKKAADPEAFKDKNYRKNIMNELDYLDPTLYQLEYIGEERANGKNCDKIKATLANGKISYLYFDQQKHLMAKSEVIANPETNSYSTVLYDDYKKFGDLLYETKQTFVSEEGNQNSKIIELYYNKNISNQDFE